MLSACISLLKRYLFYYIFHNIILEGATPLNRGKLSLLTENMIRSVFGLYFEGATTLISTNLYFHFILDK